MKKSMKIIIASLLAMPLLSLGLTLSTTTSVLAATYTCKDAKVVADASKCTPPECDTSAGLVGGAGCTAGTGQATSLFGPGGAFTTITNTLLFVIGAISVLMLIYGGIRYTLSAGDSAAVTAAKNTILYAIVGIVVAIMAFAIVNFVLTQFIK